MRGLRDTLRTAADSAKAADTTGVPNFLPPDSVMQRLMSLGGYNVTRYQAEVITFEAATRGAALTRRALVERDSQIVKSDTIVYSGQTLNQGGKVTREPGPVKGGTTVIAFVEDPDGYKIELIEHA